MSTARESVCPDHSPGPSISPTRARRLSSRRGSVTAPDPWGNHSSINMNPLRSMTSKLTIVRVPPQSDDESPRRHRRHGSNASLNSNASGKSEGSRMSFAFTSFSPPSSGGAFASAGRPASPSSSPRIRPHSPSLSRRYSGSLPTQTKLSPEQLVDLARQSCHPRPSVSAANTPVMPTAPAPVPVSFTPMPDSVYLPFLDRPGEVSALISTMPSAKLFALLAQTFQAELHPRSGPEPIETLLSTGAKQWSYADLEYWLKTVDRDVVNDVLWVSKARTCVMAHSELIWERIKGALGVPPELDGNEDELLSVDGDVVSGVAVERTAEPYPSVFEYESPPDSSMPKIDEPVQSPDEISIEPVLAACTPPPTADPAHGSTLQEVREEDEEDDIESAVAEDPEVHGLRIVTSPSRPRSFTASPGAEPSSYRLPSPSVERRAVLDEADIPYDAMRERGPGHPLFPSSFAHLTLAPTLHANYRSQSVFLPSPSAYAGVYRTGTDIGTNLNRGRPEWVQGWDSARHEFAVASSTGSLSGRE